MFGKRISGVILSLISSTYCNQLHDLESQIKIKESDYEEPSYGVNFAHLHQSPINIDTIHEYDDRHVITHEDNFDQIYGSVSYSDAISHNGGKSV